MICDDLYIDLGCGLLKVVLLTSHSSVNPTNVTKSISSNRIGIMLGSSVKISIHRLISLQSMMKQNRRPSQTGQLLQLVRLLYGPVLYTDPRLALSKLFLISQVKINCFNNIAILFLFILFIFCLILLSNKTIWSIR